MPRLLFSVWKNYLLFGLDFFSVPLLLATLFSPWRKYRWNYPRAFDVGEYVNTFVSNSFSRIIGAICRLVLIVTGVVVEALIFFVGFAGILFWMLLPCILIFLISVLYGI